MQSFSAITTSELRWLNPKRPKSPYELREGDALVATLAWTRGASATAQTSAATFNLSRHGWFRQRILVHDGVDQSSPSSGEPIATFTQRGGQLILADSHTCLWKKPKRWTSERIWADASAAELVRFSPSGSQTSVHFSVPAAPELPLLIVLGQYLLVLDQQDALVATTAAATVVATG